MAGRDNSVKRRRASRALAQLLPAPVRKAYRARGFVSHEIATRWAEIVGAELAEVSAPLKLHFRRGERTGGVLEVRSPAAFATELLHRGPQIVERVNTFFGYGAVARLRLVQGPLPPRRVPPRVQREVAPDSQRSARAEALARRVKDDKLQALIRRWGAEILNGEEP